METIRRHHISFKHALDGLFWAFTSQPNFRVHFFLSILVLIMGFLFKISFLEFTIIILTIVFGLGIEMVNTSIEAMTDLIITEYREQAKIAKDVAAGMMLLVAFGTIFVALLIFTPKILLIYQ